MLVRGRGRECQAEQSPRVVHGQATVEGLEACLWAVRVVGKRTVALQ